MYRVISIEDYMVTRNIRLENSDTGTIDECFDDSSLVSKMGTAALTSQKPPQYNIYMEMYLLYVGFLVHEID